MRLFLISVFLSSAILLALADNTGTGNLPSNALPPGAVILSSSAVLVSKSRQRRDVLSQSQPVESEEKIVSMKLFGSDLQVMLRPEVGLFAPDFSVSIVGSDGEKKRYSVDTTEFMTGEVISNNSAPVTRTVVSAHIPADGGLNMRIDTQDDTFYVEPAGPYGGKKGEFVAYKESQFTDKDVGSAGASAPDARGGWCPEVTVPEDAVINEPDEVTPPSEGGIRKKRQAAGEGWRSRCTVHLVADYKFYALIGEANSAGVKTTAQALVSSYLVERIQRVNAIYKRTSFNGLMGWGFTIKSILIHDAYTESGISIHYNNDRTWEYEDLLKKFSREDFSMYCLAHLFTYQNFDGVLGLAYVGTPEAGRAGGICSPSLGGDQKSVNTGWTSAMDRREQRVSMLQADLVTTHEFGHNWGAPHDPNDVSCSPNSAGGGKYIMYPYSVSGAETNNRVFSSCAVTNIEFVLKKKSGSCFSEPMDASCGNKFREGKEECDGGVTATTCCTEKCKLASGAQCSPINDICCTDRCHFQSQGVQCAVGVEQQCQGTFTCSGQNGSCFDYVKLSGIQCEYDPHSLCVDGICANMCEQLGKKSCICDDETLQCKHCCMTNGVCEPVVPQKDRVEGSTCQEGYCDASGVCKRETKTTVQHYWNYIQKLNINTLAVMMKDNIVGVSIIISLVLWIPASCVVYCIDKKNEAEAEQESQWAEGRINNADRTLLKPSKNIYSHGMFDSNSLAGRSRNVSVEDRNRQW